MSMSVLLGIFVILSGVGDIYLRNKLSKYYEKDTTNLSLISGVVQIILGIIILVDIQTTFVALPYMFAIWFIFTSIIGIIIISPLKIFSYGIWTSLVILNILGVIIGFMMINNPMSASITIVTLVGFYFLFLGLFLKSAKATAEDNILQKVNTNTSAPAPTQKAPAAGTTTTLDTTKK